MDLDCYFFVDVSVPPEKRCVSVLCTDCHDRVMPDGGWFYRGSEEGYGPFNFQCCECEKIIHAEES